ncbi:MAG: AbrB/MazE/SpoVT family DNA-binding domain-containing protein [Planctomycetes bacterium]|nr:AbrB/MazE/SpoVT family DNA-binding domain-containing protein [Planctomycetota bacterium]
MKITSKGQVTIPVAVREEAGLLPGTEVEFALSGGRVVVRKVETGQRGQRLIAALRGKGTVRMTTDQIMALTRGER